MAAGLVVLAPLVACLVFLGALLAACLVVLGVGSAGLGGFGAVFVDLRGLGALGALGVVFVDLGGLGAVGAAGGLAAVEEAAPEDEVGLLLFG